MRPTLNELQALLPLATPAQARAVEAVMANGDNYTAAAKAIGVSRATLRNAVDALMRRATSGAVLGSVPPGHGLRGVSTLVDGDGNIKQQWIKSQQDREQQEQLLKDAVEAACSSIKREKAIAAPKNCNDDLLNLFVITDYHIGMRSWPEETGDKWDTDIAEDLLYRWFEAAIKRAPKAGTAVFGQIGDFLHYDGLEAVTPNSGHVLDADTRYQKLVRIAIRAIRRITRELLKSHDRVHLVMCDANHDESGSAWLRELSYALYEDEPRVTVDRSPDTYYCYEWGSTALFFHHGHKRKPESIDSVLASKFRETFGRTKHCYAHMGHFHHLRALETNLMIVEQHPTLAAKDAYASRGGYLAGRRASAISYHKDHGEVGRVTISPEMLGP